MTNALIDANKQFDQFIVPDRVSTSSYVEFNYEFQLEERDCLDFNIFFGSGIGELFFKDVRIEEIH